MRVSTRIAAIASLACLSVTAADAQSRPRSASEVAARKAVSQKVRAARPSRNPDGGNVIRYDPGAPTGTRRTSAGYYYFGNVFDTQSGSPLSAGTLSGVSWFQGDVGGGNDGSVGNVGFVITHAGGSAQFLNATGVMSSTTNAVMLTLSVTPPFFIGFYAVSPAAAQQGSFGDIGYNTGSTNSQGFHANQRDFSGSGSAPLTVSNAAVRALGGVAIPVELLEFEVD